MLTTGLALVFVAGLAAIGGLGLLYRGFAALDDGCDPFAGLDDDDTTAATTDVEALLATFNDDDAIADDDDLTRIVEELQARHDSGRLSGDVASMSVADELSVDITMVFTAVDLCRERAARGAVPNPHHPLTLMGRATD